MSSLSKVTVEAIEKLYPHPNADRLDIVEVCGCTGIVERGLHREGDLVIFVPYDMIAPEDGRVPEFIRGKRIRPMKLRNIFSMCVCLPNKDNHPKGTDLTEVLGFLKWEPPTPSDELGIPGPSNLHLSKYDIESLRKYQHNLTIGEEVVIVEKIDGESTRICYREGKVWVGSRGRWIVEGNNQWWNPIRKCGLIEQLEADQLEDFVFFGENYGGNPKFPYDAPKGKRVVRFFDIRDVNPKFNTFVDYDEFETHAQKAYGLPLAPVLYRGPWKGLEAHKELGEGKSSLGDHLKEGYVVRPIQERLDENGDRVVYKYISEEYLLKTR